MASHAVVLREMTALDERVIEPPRDLIELSYSHQREHVEAIEGAKKPETRTRRIAATVKDVAARKPRTKR